VEDKQHGGVSSTSTTVDTVYLVNSLLRVDRRVKLIDFARKPDISLGIGHIFRNKLKNTQFCADIFPNNTNIRLYRAHGHAFDRHVQSRREVSAVPFTVDGTCFNMGYLAPYKHPQPENTHYLTRQCNSEQRHQ
jgi:hypothetical protein